ncbi:hypothetical protein J22TS3_31700 [Paenibacillus sp. J22TS3]|nr:hypothetical protein J22TS3_31700 [Paenibacillus sp. J22TS3]
MIPAIRVSVISHFEDAELPFKCNIAKTNNMAEALSHYRNHVQFPDIDMATIKSVENDCDSKMVEAGPYLLPVYSQILKCYPVI